MPTRTCVTIFARPTASAARACGIAQVVRQISLKGSLQSRRAHSVDALPTALIVAALGVALVAFGLYATASAALGWDPSIRRPMLAACFFGAFTTFFAVLGTWAVAEAISTRFQLNGSRLIARSLWVGVDCDLSAVGRVVWSKTGAITLTADGATVTVHPDIVRRRAWRVAAISLHKALPRPSKPAGGRPAIGLWSGATGICNSWRADPLVN